MYLSLHLSPNVSRVFTFRRGTIFEQRGAIPYLIEINSKPIKLTEENCMKKMFLMEPDA
jgi:hypothetical protein